MNSRSGPQAQDAAAIVTSWPQWLLLALLLVVVSLAPKVHPDSRPFLDSDSVHLGISQQGTHAALVAANSLSRHSDRAVCYLDRLPELVWAHATAAADPLHAPALAIPTARYRSAADACPLSINARPYSPRSPPALA